MEINKIEQEIKQAFNEIEHPVLRKNLTELGAFGSLEKDGDRLRLVVLTANDNRKEQIDLEAKIRARLNDLEIPVKVKIRFEVDASQKEADIGNRIAGVKNIIAIGSGKGGVGKSTVSANLAISLAEAGFKVGLIDADIYGPSLGKMFGLPGKQKLDGDGQNTIIPHTAHGVKLISFSFMLGMDQAVVWRGPMLGKAIEQFLFQVQWGELDYLLIDLPPGTGDVQLSLTQLIDLDGALIVTTPQNVALQDAGRAISMFFEVKVPVLGVIENMSSFECPNCQHVSHIFSQNGGDSIAARFHVPMLGAIPIQQSIMEAGEQGIPVVLDTQTRAVAEAFKAMHQKIDDQIEKYR